MPKDTKSSGYNKAPACESRGFGHKKEGENFDTPSSLRFEKKTIYELTGYLSEWYGMDIRLDPSLPTDQAYTFTITHESLEEVLCLIAKITPIEYVFDEDNTVRITRK